MARKAGGLAQNFCKSTVCRTPEYMLFLLEDAYQAHQLLFCDLEHWLFGGHLRPRYRYEWAGFRQGLFNAHFLECQDSLDMWLWFCSPVLVEQVFEAVG